jgi:hypothetical protein
MAVEAPGKTAVVQLHLEQCQCVMRPLESFMDSICLFDVVSFGMALSFRRCRLSLQLAIFAIYAELPSLIEVTPGLQEIQLGARFVYIQCAATDFFPVQRCDRLRGFVSLGISRKANCSLLFSQMPQCQFPAASSKLKLGFVNCPGVLHSGSVFFVLLLFARNLHLGSLLLV